MNEPGDIHHVMSHSIDSLNLFENESDYGAFTNILKMNFEKYDCHCYAFVCMNNHYHLLIRPSGNTFSKLMQTINNTFARYINKTRNRRGYVFYDRFKSIPTRDLEYVKNLVLYIHGNPLRANIIETVDDLSSYTWSSHRALIGKDDSFPWLNRDYVLSLFSREDSGTTYLEELTRYEQQTNETFDSWNREIDREIPQPELPSAIFHEEAAWVRKTIKEAELQRIFREKVIRVPGVIQKLLNSSCDYFSIDRQTFDENIKRKTRSISSVIKLFSYWAIEAGISGTVIGRILKRSNTAVLRAASYGKLAALQIPFPVETG
jgi:REP element-mobilizing transposase RayT